MPRTSRRPSRLRAAGEIFGFGLRIANAILCGFLCVPLGPLVLLLGGWIEGPLLAVLVMLLHSCWIAGVVGLVITFVWAELGGVMAELGLSIWDAILSPFS